MGTAHRVLSGSSGPPAALDAQSEGDTLTVRMEVRFAGVSKVNLDRIIVVDRFVLRNGVAMSKDFAPDPSDAETAEYIARTGTPLPTAGTR